MRIGFRRVRRVRPTEPGFMELATGIKPTFEDYVLLPADPKAESDAVLVPVKTEGFGILT
jgi:hypothetical protein